MTQPPPSAGEQPAAPAADAGAGELASPASPVVARAAITPGKLGMWVFLATDAMGFGGLLVAYAALRARAATWPPPAERFDRTLAAILTFVLLVSAATMASAVAAARAGRVGAARALVVVTALAGVVFVAGQAAEFHALMTTHHLGLSSDHSAGLFFVITGYHGLHVVAGVLLLAVGGLAALRGLESSPRAGDGAGRAQGAGRSAERSAGTLAVIALYWQFVDIVWIAIFTALYLLSPVARG